MKILIVDDEETARYGIRKALQVKGRIYEAANLQAARRIMADERPELILLDLNLDGQDGFELLDEVAPADPVPKVIVITAHGSEKIAVEAMKKGAFDYLAKPFDIDELRLLARNAFEQIELSRENRVLKAELAAVKSYGEIIGASDAMRKVFSLVDRVAETDVTVLLSGESGSGKELVAREIHRRSPRSKAEMVSVNCAALPENLIESELFGHERGAFTGAADRRIGKFEKARGGTLFLDEIGDMAVETQAKILRALESRQIERLGGNEPIPVDVRIVSATNRNLKRMVEEKAFREDLFYRLEVVRIEIPALRSRKGDIPLLVEHFRDLFALRHGRPTPEVSPEALARLVAYSWPGNVRQLRNMMESLVVLTPDGCLEEKDLPEEVRFYVASREADISGNRLEPLFRLDYKGARESFEVKYLLWQLRQHNNNITHTAEAIGIHRQSLQQKIKELSLRDWMDG